MYDPPRIIRVTLFTNQNTVFARLSIFRASYAQCSRLASVAARLAETLRSVVPTERFRIADIIRPITYRQLTVSYSLAAGKLPDPVEVQIIPTGKK